MRRVVWKGCAGLLAAAAALALAAGEDKQAGDAKDAAARAAAGSGLDDWLKTAEPAMTQPTTQPEGVNPFEDKDVPAREDAVPGVVELSDGTVLAGRLYTTREKPWLVYVAAEKRWRRVPLIALLSVQAVVVEEKMEQEWRWKEMGVAERVYTGRQYPTRRLQWQFHLIDGSRIAGEVKGQPLWVQAGDGQSGPFVLHERSKGQMGQKLHDLIYLKRAIVSRRMMEQVLGKRPPARGGEGGS